MSELSRPVPPALRALASSRNAGDEATQRSVRWTRSSWQHQLPEQSDFLSSLPAALSRADIANLCRGAASSPHEAQHGFIAAMVWGYGPVGYGAYRTAHVLRENLHAAEVLQRVAGVACAEGGPAAFRMLSGVRLKGLGVAFATKYLFFCAADRSPIPAPILDRLVRGWLARHAN